MAEDHRIYAERRARALARLGDAALILPAAPPLRSGWDSHLRYRVDPDLFYLTGYSEPEAVAVLAPGGEAAFTMFVRARDPDAERWTGVRGGLDAARDEFGADAAFDVAELPTRLPQLLAAASAVYLRFDTPRDDVVAVVRRALADARRARQKAGTGPAAWLDAGAILDPMRLIKDAHEIALVREAAQITAESFREAAAQVRPGAGEWELEAAVESGFRRRGADGPAFPTIAAAGANATVLHYDACTSRLADGELVLLDAGAQYRNYAGDVSRTFPVGGRFTAAQRELYDAVLAAHDAAIGSIVPGAPVSAPNDAAKRILLDALVSLGALSGTVDELLEQPETYRPFIPHGTSHWLGLDVHDVGAYADRDVSTPLQPGMVLTVEPGLYLPVGSDNVPRALQGTGIRIEDDVLVTDDAAEVLTSALPAAADEIERLTGNN